MYWPDSASVTEASSLQHSIALALSTQAHAFLSDSTDRRLAPAIYMKGFCIASHFWSFRSRSASGRTLREIVVILRLGSFPQPQARVSSLVRSSVSFHSTVVYCVWATGIRSYQDIQIPYIVSVCLHFTRWQQPAQVTSHTLTGSRQRTKVQSPPGSCTFGLAPEVVVCEISSLPSVRLLNTLGWGARKMH